MIIAPYADQAHKDFQDIIKFIPEKYILKISARWLTITLMNGSTINMKSAENLDGLRGFTLDWVIIDEAAYCSEEVWKIIQPELAIRKGRAWIISSPWTKGWLFDLYRMEEIDPKRYKSYHFISTDSPFYDQEEAESYRQTHTELEYRTELMAEFLDGGAVFNNLERIMVSTPSEPIPGHSYIAGSDIASANDFTVIKIFDVADRREVHHVRLGDRSWSSIKTTIYMTCMRYNRATLFIDQTGVGASVVEDLRQMTRGYESSSAQGYLNIVPFIFTSKSKPELMANYMLAMENMTIRLLPDQITKKEHESLEMKKSEGATGYIRYAAPKGRHDDCVMSSALAVWGLDRYAGNQLAGPFTENELNPLLKKKIDPSMQIDVEEILLKSESRQIAGFGADENQDICSNYD
jgi:phage FluMu gp28-like protein